MNFDDFKNLDPNSVGNWPIPVKIVVIACLCAAALGAGYYFDTQNQLADLAKNEKKEKELLDDFRSKHWKASTLGKLKEQLAEVERSLGELQKQLPSEAEVAGLIQDISQSAIASGLKSELFKPGKEVNDEKGVYVKYPISLRLSGEYHAFGRFISSVAAMPRIVTQHDIIIKSASKTKQPDSTGSDYELTMEMTAQIYRYLEEAPEEAPAVEKKKDTKDAPTAAKK